MDGDWQAAIRLARLGANCMNKRRAQGAKKAKAAVQKRVPEGRGPSSKLADELHELKTELALARTRLAELETRVDEDPLTGLLNRRGFVKSLERSLAFVQRYRTTAALIFLDLDGFKAVNDRHGHAAGDWVLGQVARLIGRHVRASDVAGRVGGDEFVVLLWNLAEKQAQQKALALEELIASVPFEQSGKRYAVGISAGLTMLTADDSSEAVLARADQAMYARKRERRSGSH